MLVDVLRFTTSLALVASGLHPATSSQQEKDLCTASGVACNSITDTDNQANGKLHLELDKNTTLDLTELTKDLGLPPSDAIYNSLSQGGSWFPTEACEKRPTHTCLKPTSEVNIPYRQTNIDLAGNAINPLTLVNAINTHPEVIYDVGMDGAVGNAVLPEVPADVTPNPEATTAPQAVAVGPRDLINDRESTGRNNVGEKIGELTYKIATKTEDLNLLCLIVPTLLAGLWYASSQLRNQKGQKKDEKRQRDRELLIKVTQGGMQQAISMHGIYTNAKNNLSRQTTAHSIPPFPSTTVDIPTIDKDVDDPKYNEGVIVKVTVPLTDARTYNRVVQDAQAKKGFIASQEENAKANDELAMAQSNSIERSYRVQARKASGQPPQEDCDLHPDMNDLYKEITQQPKEPKGARERAEVRGHEHQETNKVINERMSNEPTEWNL